MGRKSTRGRTGKAGRRATAGTGAGAEKTSTIAGDATGAVTGEVTGASTGEEAGGVRVLPVDTGANSVEVDEERIAAEMAAAVEASDAGAQPGAPVAAEEGAPAPSTWAPMCPGVVAVLDTFVVPNWQLKPEEKDGLAEALAPVLDDLFPGGLGSERWAPYFRLLAVAGGIVLTRWDREKGLPPLHAEPESKKGAASGVVQPAH